MLPKKSGRGVFNLGACPWHVNGVERWVENAMFRDCREVVVEIVFGCMSDQKIARPRQVYLRSEQRSYGPLTKR